MFRRYAAGQGFHGAPVGALAQDARGFLWIGAEDGLYRYDGTAFRRWAGQTIPGPVRSIAASGVDRLAVLTDSGSLFDVHGDAATRLDAPLPAGRGQPNTLAFDARGRLWVVRGGRLAYRRHDGVWHLFDARAFDGEPPRIVRAGPDGTMAVATPVAIWRVGEQGEPRPILETRHAADFVFLPDGAVAVVDSAIRVQRTRGGLPQVLDPFRTAAIRPRPIAMVQRGGTLWVSYDRYVVAVRPGQAPEVMGADVGVESGGPMLVDREGSLWMGTFTSLLQYPEPETRIWNERTGLRSQHTRFIGRSNDALWVTTWQGTVLINPDQGEARWLEEWFSQGEVCEDTAGGVWLAVPGAVIRAMGSGIVVRHATAAASTTQRCASDRDGGVWLAMGDALVRADARGVHPVMAPPRPPGARSIQALLHSGSGLWIGGEGMTCRGEVADAHTIRAWRCASLPRGGLAMAFHETADHGLWAATSRAGVMRWDGQGWQPMPGNQRLPSQSLLNLIPSPSGGVWIIGHGVVWRVQPVDEGRNWRVLERLGEWHGLPLESGRDLHEEPDGRIWITTSLGVIDVAPSARTHPHHPPPVALVEALVGEEPVDPHVALELSHGRDDLELRFAVLAFRDPGRLRYQVRLSRAQDWREATGRPWYRWIDLTPGSHRAELRATLDGERWTLQPASFSFRVRPAWYRTAEATAFFALAVAFLLWLVYRARVRYLLGLERERTRIAMDLHDEMGSGLGSIGILSGVLASRRNGDAASAELARRIASMAEDLGGALSDIIWSLDARPATLSELASRLAESGLNLLAAQGINFRTAFPGAWPSGRLAARARRNLLLIGLEALHNAARHAEARHVTLGFHGRGLDWEMRIGDDGVGFAPGATGVALHGVRTMTRRAREIGASIEWQALPGRGTTLVLRFSLASSRVRRPWARTRAPSARWRRTTPPADSESPPDDDLA